MQEVPQQRPGWMFPRWVSVGRDRDGGHGGSGERSRRNADLVLSFGRGFGRRLELKQIPFVAV